ncbi:hypothetical protein QFZ37_001568 [Chryseobacterium ginsenosidimutans]|uniref:hypothetical protein n=1 Tax=Chryseobacterium ginsenosidimutans TaxID=687846 RepID=UPI002786CC82|nr:hypothetical protein [Chryseobacterium ginsenosidimutans]MDQ0593199.1 hypothetical protein [Chryseobacterium ginsenosidimutans]
MKEPKRRTSYIRQVKKKTAKVTIWEYDYDGYETAGEVYYETQNQQPKVKVGKGFVPHGGIVLRNIHNYGYRMAYDIGVVGIYVFPGPKAKENGFTKPKFLILGPPEFVQVDSKTYKPLDPNKEFDPKVEKITNMDGIDANMAVYNADRVDELRATYCSTYELFGAGSGYLFVTQKFIMTKYSDKPAHEPSGGLKAARFFPITQLMYNVPQNSPDKIEDYVESFRVDYRLYINLDTYAKKEEIIMYSSEDTPGVKAKINSRSAKTKDRISNAAGFFKDEDELELGDISGGVADMIFSSSEKPLVSEIVTEGLNPYSKNLKWDNIHWWGMGKDGVLGSTPGSFHAVHIHWKWAKGMQSGGWKKPKHSGEAQFAGKGNNGALVDSAIKNQILRLAVVKNKGLPQNHDEHRSPKFKDFFMKLRENKPPEPLKNGEDIVLYYSSEVKLKDCKKNAQKGINCSIFVHGLFFAHEVEREAMTTGATDNFYVNPKTPNNKIWERYPQK